MPSGVRSGAATMNDSGKATVLASGVTAAPRRLTYWAMGIVAGLTVVIAGIGLIVALMYRLDRAARLVQPPLVPSLRALEIENKELHSEVTQLKLELERRLYAAADRRESAAIEPAPTDKVAPVTAQRMRSPLLGKGLITRAGL